MQINNSAIISRRIEYGMSQKSLALKTRVPSSTISRLEKRGECRLYLRCKNNDGTGLNN